MRTPLRGFTLIELLVVIAVLGVLAGGVFVAINPLKRINQANDAKIKSDIGQIANAMQAYYITHQFYPTNTQDLVDSGDLKTKPQKPGGGDYEMTTPGGGVCNSPCTDVVVSAPLAAPQTAGANWQWSSTTGQAGESTAPTPTVTLAATTAPTATATPIPGLIARWKMEDNWQDSQGTNHGTSNGGATFVTGKSGFGKAGSFNGNTSYINGTIPSSTFSGDWTITAWFNHASMTTWAGIFSNNMGNNAAVMTMKNQTTYFGINQVGTSDNGVYVNLGDDHYNKWILGVITRQGNTLTVYAYKDNNLIQQSASLSWTLNTTNGFYIGRHYQTGIQIFNGLIDDVRIYNRGLSAAEVQALTNGAQ